MLTIIINNRSDIFTIRLIFSFFSEPTSWRQSKETETILVICGLGVFFLWVKIGKTLEHPTKSSYVHDYATIVVLKFVLQMGNSSLAGNTSEKTRLNMNFPFAWTGKLDEKIRRETSLLPNSY